MNTRSGLILAAAVLTAGPAAAQYNVQWVQFQNETTTRLVSADPSLGINDIEEKDYAWGDVDKDGDIDLVVVRKEPFTTPGRRVNVLFMNENGVLVNRTDEYATDSDVPGDNGFQTMTNDRDVVLVDVNGDTWLDIATAVTISDGLPKAISHPRIYVNKGAVGGVWQGFRFEAGRSPQLYVLKSNGDPDFNKPNPGRFCSIAAGDVDDDGDIDLFLGDYDSSGAGGGGEPAGIDLNDRLWINDGNGFFADSYQTRMNANMLLSAFSNSAAIADMNGDGLNDVIKDTALNAPQFVGIAYNRPPNPIDFNLYQEAHDFAPYFVSVGDLNNDQKLDMVVTDDVEDRYRLNQGNDALGQVIWGPALKFSWPSGQDEDDGFGSQNLMVDLDQDGLKDVLIADVDVDIEGCDRRMHVYHNLGPEGGNVVLREEAQQSGSGGWKGAVGFSPSSVLKGTHNVAAFDIDKDGDKDLVIGRCTGTSVWMNVSNPCKSIKYGQALPNSTGLPAVIAATGVPAGSVNNLKITVSQLPPGVTGTLMVGGTKVEPCVPYGDGLRCVGAPIERGNGAIANGAGQATMTINLNSPPWAGLSAGDVRYVQFRFRDPSGGPAQFNLSDALEIHFCE
jgi:hypothetical protein